MEDSLTWDAIRAIHPDQWVLIRTEDSRPGGEPRSGVVLRHSRDRIELVAALKANPRCELLWTGPSSHSGERTWLAPQAHDTPLAIRELQIESYKAMDAEQKVRLIEGMWRTGGDLAMAGIRARYPDADEDTLRWHLAVTRLGHDLACRVFGPSPSAPAAPRR